MIPAALIFSLPHVLYLLKSMQDEHADFILDRFITEEIVEKKRNVDKRLMLPSSVLGSQGLSDCGNRDGAKPCELFGAKRGLEESCCPTANFDILSHRRTC